MDDAVLHWHGVVCGCHGDDAPFLPGTCCESSLFLCLSHNNNTLQFGVARQLLENIIVHCGDEACQGNKYSAFGSAVYVHSSMALELTVVWKVCKCPGMWSLHYPGHCEEQLRTTATYAKHFAYCIKQYIIAGEV